MYGQDDAYKAAIELAGALDGARFDLTEARLELRTVLAENARILQHISPELRSKLDNVTAWLLDVESAIRGAVDESNEVCNLMSPDAESETQLRDLARMVLDVDRGIVDASDLRRRALDVAGELMEAL